MILQLILIRFKQLYRILKQVGWLRAFILIGIISLLSHIYIIKIHQSLFAYYALAAILFIIVSIHFKRKDLFFLKCNFYNYKYIIAFEYYSISFPILLSLLIHSHWVAFGILIKSIFLISNMNFKIKYHISDFKIFRFIPLYVFEWRAGTRRNYIILIIIWLISLFFSFIVVSVPLGLFIISVILISFIESNESYQMIIAYEISSHDFLKSKFINHIKLYFFITSPLVLFFLIFNYNLWYVILIEYIILILIQIYYIFIKYSFYVPNEKSPAVQVFGAIGFLAAFVPFLWPVLLFLLIRFYFKSINNLNFYLNDFNT